MESLTQHQIECYDDIIRIKTNFKKDASSRKTKLYISSRIQKLDEIWRQFLSTDEKLKDIKATNPEHAYYIKGYFNEVETVYNDLRLKLQHKWDELDEDEKRKAVAAQLQAGESDETGEETAANIDLRSTIEEKCSLNEDGLRSHHNKLLRTQAETMRLLERLLESEDNTTENKSKFYYQHRLNSIQVYWAKICNNHSDIVSDSSSVFSEYLSQQKYEKMEDHYEQIMVKLLEKLETPKYIQSDVKLPRLTLPTFDGEYSAWTSFHDIFSRLIHTNDKLGKAEKMQYLKTHLRKDAASLLQHLCISEANYDAAWKLLGDRYDNKRKLISIQVQALMNQPKLEHESEINIRKLYDTTKECLHALENLGVDTTTWAPIIGHIVIQKLDIESHKLYEQQLEKPREPPTYEQIYRFLETRFQSLESLRDSKRNIPSIYKKQEKNGGNRFKMYHATSSLASKCKHCHQEHKLFNCPKLQSLDVPQRRDFIRQSKICFNCLSHPSNEKCYSKHKCNICQEQHHTMLHIKKSNEDSTKQLNSHVGERSCNVLLATALVVTKAFDGTQKYLRILVDQGSQASFITEEAAQMLRLPKIKEQAEISGLGITNAGTTRYKIKLQLTPRFPSEFKLMLAAYVMPKLTKLLPDDKISIDKGINFWKNNIISDPNYDTPGPIDMIIGADVYPMIILEGLHKLQDGVVAQNTNFGWILSGNTTASKPARINLTSMVSNIALDDTMKKFWEIEEVSSNNAASNDDERCEEHYNNTHLRHKNGTYMVRIPFKDNVELGETKHKALARLLQIERKFETNKKLESEYKKFMKEYISLKHMTLAPTASHSGYFLPHHAVLKEDSTTTKLRVVFDASMKSSNNVSLNDITYIGPKLQGDIATILLRWRMHRYVFTADVEKMYRQIQIHPDDQDFQKILWRFSSKDPIQEYKLTTVTYGTASAPFLAMKTLQQLAHDESKNFPEASRIIHQDFYVDDLMTGTNTIRDAKRIRQELIQLLKAGGFTLRKWASNQTTLIEDLPKEMIAEGMTEISDHENSIKTLGVLWLPASDIFKFRSSFPIEDTLTKRKVLSTIAKIFDPLGWLSPIVITAKILMQELWFAEATWDQPLPPIFASKWIRFKTEFETVQSLSIPRWFHLTPWHQGVEIHGFCDASEKAYAAVVYIKTVTEHGRTVITLLAAKTKVAPLKKTTTIPRLELCAALLLSQLISRIKNTLNIPTATIYAWSDSTITLAWIKSASKRWGTFVTHRTSEIRSLTNPDDWNHIKTEDNPADCASRGIYPSQLQSHPLWWKGPQWLGKPRPEWPIATTEFQTSLEQSKQHSVHTTALCTDKNNILSQFSNFHTLVRVHAYVFRFIANCKTTQEKRTKGYLTTSEIYKSLTFTIRLVQRAHYDIEISSISKGKPLSYSSRLSALAPFLDSEGLLRLGGRLEKSTLSYNEKHPIILPHSHHVTNLIIEDAHHKTLHGGNQLTLAYVRRRYWIIDGKNAVKRIIRKCVTCCRHRLLISEQMMGNLPAPRVTPSRPFTNTGVDYAGPISLRISKGRGTKSYKGYIAVFVCFATKAIHIEVVSDLTTQAFLAAYKRFVARRGLCLNLFSDNGTTFIGARTEITKQFELAVQQAHKGALPYLINNGTQWHFNPPAAPHFGGLWEAGVKSIKYHLKRIIGETLLTYEELATTLCQIEACLNSRPLYPMTSDPLDLTILTPGHFLIGSNLNAPPEPVDTNSPVHGVSRWKLINKLQQDFWQAWSTEYLARLQQRPKWKTPHGNFKIGDMVIMKEQNTPPTKWPMARIIEVHPGTDGLVRVVTIQTITGKYKRPVNRICKLPMEETDTIDVTTKNHSNLLPQSNVVPTPDSPSTTISVNNSHIKRSKPIRIRPTNISPRPNAEEIKRRCIRRPSVILTALLVLSHCIPTLGMNIQTIDKAENSEPTTVEVQAFIDNPGLYFEDIGTMHIVNNKWTTIIYYNLTGYYDELRGFKTCMDKLTSYCQQTITLRYYCESTLNEFIHMYDDFLNNDVLIHHRDTISRKRMVRSPLDIIGHLQNSLFGVLDNEYAEYIEQELHKIKDNENTLFELAQNQTSILDGTVNIFRKSIHDIEKQFQTFQEHIKYNEQVLSEEIKGENTRQAFALLTGYLTLIMSKFEKQQQKLMELIVTTNKISPLLISPDQLLEQIQFIRRHIPSTLQIPGEREHETLRTLYQIMTHESRLLNNTLIFKLHIPLLGHEIYQLFKLHPAPTTHGIKLVLIEPADKFFAVNLHRDSFYPMSQLDLQKCSALLNAAYICEQVHPINRKNAQSNHCEIGLINHEPITKLRCNIRITDPWLYLQPLQIANQWIFFSINETILSAVCNNRLITQILHGSGILTLGPNCEAKTGAITLTSQTSVTSRQKTSFLPKRNLTTALKETSNGFSLRITHLDALNTQELDELRMSPISSHLPNEINFHHVHHYFVTYLIIAVALSTGAYIIYKKKSTASADFNVRPITPTPAIRSKPQISPPAI